MIIEVDGVGPVEFPDDATDDQIKSFVESNFGAPRAPYQRPALAEAGVSLARGAAKVVPGLLRLGGEVADAVRRRFPDAPGSKAFDVGGDQSALTTAAESINGFIDRQLPRSDSAGFWTGDVAEGVGQVIPALGAARLAGALGATPRMVAAQAAAMGFGMEFESAFTRELERQAAAGEQRDPDKAFLKAVPYATGASIIEGTMGAGRIAGSIEKLLAGEAGQELLKRGVSPNAIRQVLGSSAKEAGVGYVQEGMQRGLEDAIVDGRLNPEGINNEGMVGAVVQGLLRVPVAALEVRDSQRIQRDIAERKAADAAAAATAYPDPAMPGGGQWYERPAGPADPYLTSEPAGPSNPFMTDEPALPGAASFYERPAGPDAGPALGPVIGPAMGGRSFESGVTEATNAGGFTPVDRFITDTLATRAQSNKREAYSVPVLEPGVTEPTPPAGRNLRSRTSLDDRPMSEEERVSLMTPAQRREYDAALRDQRLAREQREAQAAASTQWLAAAAAREDAERRAKLAGVPVTQTAAEILGRSGHQADKYLSRFSEGGTGVVAAEVIQTPAKKSTKPKKGVSKSEGQGQKESVRQEGLQVAAEAVAPTPAPQGLTVGAIVKYKYTSERKRRLRSAGESIQKVPGVMVGRVVGFSSAGDPVVETLEDRGDKPKFPAGSKGTFAKGVLELESGSPLAWAKDKAKSGPNAYLKFSLNSNLGSATFKQAQELAKLGYSEAVALGFSEAQAAKLIYEKAPMGSDLAIDFMEANDEAASQINDRATAKLAKLKADADAKRAKRQESGKRATETRRRKGIIEEYDVAPTPTTDPESGVSLGAARGWDGIRDQADGDFAIDEGSKRLFSKLGVQVEAAAALDRPAKITLGGDGSITLSINPGVLASLTAEQQDTILTEELIHAASLRAIQQGWDNRGPLVQHISKVLGEVWAKLPASVKQDVESRYGSGSPVELAGEYIRMVVQRGRTGQISEDLLGESKPQVLSLFRKILAYIKSLFSGSSVPTQAQKIIDDTNAVLIALEGANDLPVGAAEPSPESVELGATKFFRNRSEADERLARGGTDDPSAIEAKAAAQAGLVPAEHQAKMDELIRRPTVKLADRPLTAEPYSRRRELRAARILSKVRQALAVSKQPIDFKSLPERERQGAAYMMVGLHQHIRGIRDSVFESARRLLVRQQQMRQSMKRVGVAEAMRDILSAQAGTLAKNYRSYLDHLRRTAPAESNIAAMAHRLAQRAAEQVDGQLFSMGHVQNILNWIADQPTINAGPNSSARSIVEQARAIGGYRAGMSDVDAYVALMEGFRDGTQQGPGNVSIDPVMYQVENLPDIITALRELKRQGHQAAVDMTAFEQEFGKIGAEVTPSEFIRKYNRLRDQAAGQLAIARSLSKEWARITDTMLGTTDALVVLDSIIADPVYRKSVSDAQDAIKLWVDPFEADPYGTGGIRVRNPLNPQDVVVVGGSMSTEQEAANREQLAKILVDIESYVNDPKTDPILANSYRRAAVRIQAQWMDSALAPEHNIFSTSFITSLPKRIFKFLQNPKNLAEWIGGRAGRRLVQSLLHSDLLQGRIQRLAKDKELGVMQIQLAGYDAMRSHDLDPTNPEHVRIYTRRVANPLMHSWQDDASFHYQVGHTLPSGHVITKEDFRWMQLEAKFKQAVRQESERDARDNNLASSIEDLIGAEYSTGGAKADARLRVFRKSVSDGKYVVPRGASQFASSFHQLWRDTAAISDPQQRLRARLDLLNPDSNPDWWHDIVLSYLHDANPTWTRASVFEDKLRNLVKDGAAGRVMSNWDDVADYLGRPVPEVQAQLVNEIDAMVSTFGERVLSKIAVQDDGVSDERTAGEVGLSPEAAVRRLVVESLHNDGSLLNPRGQAFGSWGLYNHVSLVHNRLAAFSAGAVNIARARVLESMDSFERELRTYVGQMREQADQWKRSGVEPSKRFQELQKLGRIRFTLSEAEALLTNWHNQTQWFKSFAERHADEFDRAALQAMNELNRSLAGTLLQSLRSIVNNATSAIFVNQVLVDGLIGGKARALLSPFITTAKLAGAAMGRLVEVGKRNPAFAKWLSQNRGAISWVMNESLKEMESVRKSRDLLRNMGVNLPYDWTNTRSFMTKYRGGGFLSADRWRRAIREKNLGALVPPGVAGLETKDEESSWALKAIRSVNNMWLPAMAARVAPRLVDQSSNVIIGAKWLRALEELMAKSVALGDSRGGNPDHTDPNHLITAAELGATPAQLKDIRDLFLPVGGLEQVMFEYYKRLRQSPESERSNVPLMDEQKLQAWMMGALERGNVIREGNSPSSFKAFGILGRIFSTFWSWPSQFWDQIDKLTATKVGDGKLSSMPLLASVGRWGPALIAIALIAIMAREVPTPLIELVTGRIDARQRLSNVLADPDPVDAARYLGATMGSMVPFVGGAAEWLVGGSSSKPLFDATSHVPLIGFVADTTTAAANTVRSGDMRVMLDWANRWTPLYAMALNRLPGVDADLDARNAARAVRAAVPADMPVRQMGGSGSAPKLTPLSRTLRSLEAAAYSGDRQEVAQRMEQAVAQQQEVQGGSEEDARRAVTSILQSRSPVSRVFGRSVTAGELDRITGRMSAGQRAAFDRSMRAYNVISEVTGRNFEMARQQRQSSRRSSLLRGLIPRPRTTTSLRRLRSVPA